MQAEGQKQQNRLWAEYISLDLVTLSAVEHRGFQNIMSNINFRINSISRHTAGWDFKILEEEVVDTLFILERRTLGWEQH